MRNTFAVKKVARKTGKGTQYAALCFRLKKGKGHEILLVTSRGRGRWIPPKGWPIRGASPDQTAAREALEEAGVKGKVCKLALGRYKLLKDPENPSRKSVEAYIFPLHVSGFAKKFKEKGQRKVKWFSTKKAAKLVDEPKLKKLIRTFDPTHFASE